MLYLTYNAGGNVELLSFADDATGAMDVGGALHSRGHSVQVCMDGRSENSQAAVTVVNLNSRYDDPELSNEKLAAALHIASTGSGVARAFLKIDSTLRGNLSDNHEIIQELIYDKPVFIAPALPFYGRTCIDGVYFVNGQPIHTTEFAGDRKFQYDTSILNEHFPGAQHIGWKTLDRGKGAVIEAVERSTEKSFTFDTRDQKDLEVIAEASLISNASIIGSSGIARAFPLTETLGSDTYIIPNLPTLFVIGSIHSTSRVQKQLFESARVITVEISPPTHLGAYKTNQTAHATAVRNLTAGMPVILSTPDQKISDLRLQIEFERILGECSNITETPYNLVIVGGETVRATLQARGIGSLLLRGEYEDGIPIATHTMTSNEAIITKAGSFGHPGTLTDIHNFIRKN